MHDVSSVRSHLPRQHQTTLLDEWLAAAARGLAWLVVAISRELRIRRDMRQLAAMDDTMLRDIGLRRGEIEYSVRCGRDA